MRKVVNPCDCKVWSPSGRERYAQAFAKIEYEEGRLSISGVIGPLKSGNCLGSAGQCVDKIRQGTPADRWDSEMLKKFCDIWDTWHLNDMRPYCSHQKELGWNNEALQKITLYHYILTDDAQKLKKQAENEALKALKDGRTFTPTEEQSKYASLETFVELYEVSEPPENYKPFKSCLTNTTSNTESRGWVSYDKSELGILCKPCPVCGYKYGSEWLKEEVPQEVIDWLFSLPESKITPAWV